MSTKKKTGDDGKKQDKKKCEKYQKEYKSLEVKCKLRAKYLFAERLKARAAEFVNIKVHDHALIHRLKSQEAEIEVLKVEDRAVIKEAFIGVAAIEKLILDGRFVNPEAVRSKVVIRNQLTDFSSIFGESISIAPLFVPISVPTATGRAAIQELALPEFYVTARPRTQIQVSVFAFSFGPGLEFFVYDIVTRQKIPVDVSADFNPPLIYNKTVSVDLLAKEHFDIDIPLDPHESAFLLNASHVHANELVVIEPFTADLEEGEKKGILQTLKQNNPVPEAIYLVLLITGTSAFTWQFGYLNRVY
jgi:hypothetical protein